METINPPIHQTFQPIFSKNPIAASTCSADNTPRETSIRNCFCGYYAYVSHKKQKSIKSPYFSTEHCPVPNSIQYALGGMEVNMGNIRETFFANQLSHAHTVEYSSTAADFLIDGKYTFEVGGSAKDGRQTAEVSNAWIAADDVEHAIGNKLPLWLFGFLY